MPYTPVTLVWYQMDGNNDIKVTEVIDMVLGQYKYVLVGILISIDFV